MYPGSSLGHLSVQLASSGAIPYDILAAGISLGIALAAVLAALSLKGRAGPPKLRSRQPSPLPGTVTGRSRPHLSMRDMATAHLVPMDAGEAGAAQAPASIDPSPGSSDPLEDTSGTSTTLTSSAPPPTPARGSDEIGLPQGDVVDGSL
jgi:hypothetical protein